MNEILLLALAMMISGCGKLPSTPNARGAGRDPSASGDATSRVCREQKQGRDRTAYPVYKPASWRTFPEKWQPKGGAPNERSKR